MADSFKSAAFHILVGAGALGAVVGAGSIATTAQGRDAIAAATRRAGVAIGAVRERPPQPGDQWGGCNDARAAGTAPIYRGEPGYRSDMDGDGDGVDCEPIR